MDISEVACAYFCEESLLGRITMCRNLKSFTYVFLVLLDYIFTHPQKISKKMCAAKRLNFKPIICIYPAQQGFVFEFDFDFLNILNFRTVIQTIMNC